GCRKTPSVCIRTRLVRHHSARMFGIVRPEDDKTSVMTRRFWFGVGGGMVFAGGLLIFAFTAYKVPLTNNGVDGIVYGPLPLAAVMGIVVGVAFEYLLETRSKPK